MLHMALGYNVAWGFTDAVMYVVSAAIVNGRRIRLVRRLRETSDPGEARRILTDALPGPVVGSVSQETIDAFRKDLATVSVPRSPLGAPEFVGALGVFAIVVLATIPSSRSSSSRTCPSRCAYRTLSLWRSCMAMGTCWAATPEDGPGATGSLLLRSAQGSLPSSWHSADEGHLGGVGGGSDPGAMPPGDPVSRLSATIFLRVASWKRRVEAAPELAVIVGEVSKAWKNALKATGLRKSSE